MSVTIQNVEHVAKLARLNFTQAEKEKFTHQLSEILSYIEKLKNVDTSNIEPLSQIAELQNIFRYDQTRPSLPREDVLMNAPDKTEEFFKVPKVITER